MEAWSRKYGPVTHAVEIAAEDCARALERYRTSIYDVLRSALLTLHAVLTPAGPGARVA